MTQILKICTFFLHCIRDRPIFHPLMVYCPPAPTTIFFSALEFDFQCGLSGHSSVLGRAAGHTISVGM